MIPVVFINCNLYPFIAWILSGKKQYETRNRNTLKNLVGMTVYLAETGRNHRPIVKAKATITEVLTIRTRTEYNSFRSRTQIKKGSVFDWNGKTKVKYLYKLSNVQPVPEFMPEGIRHGRTWMEYVPV